LKNIITWSVKIGIGLGSFLLIYWRLQSDLDSEKILFLKQTFTSLSAYGLLLACLALVPLNWGIESYKWQQITSSVESISLGKAMRSVYSGLCVGNFAPGRATEVLAKILFFKPENRAAITILHFTNGMFQLSITIILGLFSLLYKLQQLEGITTGFLYFIISFSLFLLILFCFLILRFDVVQKWIIRRFHKSPEKEISYSFTTPLVLKLLFFSIFRYLVFTFQFVLILKLFYAEPVTPDLLSSITIYFLLTTILPMISFVEAAVRAAIALIVFRDFQIAEVSLIISAVLLWLINIVLPSIAGYIIILKENFEFKFLKK
jgi:hypothetical protein